MINTARVCVCVRVCVVANAHADLEQFRVQVVDLSSVSSMAKGSAKKISTCVYMCS